LSSADQLEAAAITSMADIQSRIDELEQEILADTEPSAEIQWKRLTDIVDYKLQTARAKNKDKAGMCFQRSTFSKVFTSSLTPALV
jgi:hypothetical protein